MYSGSLLLLLGFLIFIFAFYLLTKKLFEMDRVAGRYRQILDEVEDGYYEVDLNGVCTFATKGVSRLFGYRVDEIEGVDFRKTMLPEGAEELYKKFNDAFLKEKPLKGASYKAFRKDGSVIYLETSVSFIRDKKGKIVGFRGVTRDISKRKKAERHLKKAKLEAEHASEAKSRFLANMSHEIRTPLSGVIGMAKLLMETRLNEEQKKQASTLLSSSESLLEIINDILDFSKIESGELIIRAYPLEIRSFLQEIKDMFLFRAEEKGLKFQIETENSVPEHIITDELRLKQILINLIGNAVKFTTYGSIKLNVWIDDAPFVSLVKFSVSDTGIGINEKDLPKVFETFSQADNSHSRQYGGTGLGLAIAKELVFLLKGEIDVSSVENKGSVFTISIPLVEYEDDDNSESAPKKILKSNSMEMIEKWLETNNKKALKILLAEDNKVNQELALRFLKKIPSTIDIAENGHEAVIRHEENEYDIILMDVQMPGMSGVEAVEIIRDREKKAGIVHVPIVAMTAHAMIEDKKKCMDAGMDDYVSKPVDVDRLYNAIANSISGNSCGN